MLSLSTGSAVDGDAIPVPSRRRPRHGRSACIGCGAWVAACPNASSACSTSAKIAHLALLPQDSPAPPPPCDPAWFVQMNEEVFGNCAIPR